MVTDRDTSSAGEPRPDALFVGEHAALDFLNTVASPYGQPLEWLRDGHDLVDWLRKAGLIDPEVAARFLAKDETRKLDAVAAEARALREWLRDFVLRHTGKPLNPSVLKALAPLNELLAQDTLHRHIVKATGDGAHALHLDQKRDWNSPKQLLYPIADAVADLVCHADFSLVRRCENEACTIVFYDRTKSHARRWCSMATCGNRAKAAAHRARHRLQTSQITKPAKPRTSS